MIQNGLLDFNLNEEENGVLVEGAPYSSESFKMYIPRLMPNIAKSGASTRISFDRNIFINASGCKPSVGSSVNSQGYITIKKYRSISLIYIATNGIITAGTKFKLKVMGKNVDQIFISD